MEIFIVTDNTSNKRGKENVCLDYAPAALMKH